MFITSFRLRLRWHGYRINSSVSIDFAVDLNTEPVLCPDSCSDLIPSTASGSNSDHVLYSDCDPTFEFNSASVLNFGLGFVLDSASRPAYSSDSANG
ncbi:hypothetical protein EVAR_21229_1 [Eumeta japonica]|uniref:Uncharacterized protein n=1 Tax=Eumeta variegata TaxID=151549 RepID=A0A4C1UPX5_EUMVA|nr:hypothetical protein EVAR_21229_1 [Eumeta japonica]